MTETVHHVHYQRIRALTLNLSGWIEFYLRETDHGSEKVAVFFAAASEMRDLAARLLETAETWEEQTARMAREAEPVAA